MQQFNACCKPMSRDTVKVMVVDDSKVARVLLGHIFKKAGMEVVASLDSAADALAHLEKERPDVIVMDVEMPVMDGLEATRMIMETRPLPIVIASNVLLSTDADHTFRCLEAGALALVAKPVGPAHPGFARIERTIVRTVRAMAEVKVVRRWPAKVEATTPEPLPQPQLKRRDFDFKVMAIGASTGGPNAIRAILEKLEPGFPLPILIVQHMSEGFVSGFAEWLTKVTGFAASVARDGERVGPGQVWLAPDGTHMGLDRGMRIALSEGKLEGTATPSVSYLFHSVASAVGERAVGIVLTGMGTDGAAGLKRLHDAGALTIAEHPSTAVVYGMPQAAVELGAVDLLLTPGQISRTLSNLIKKKP